MSSIKDSGKNEFAHEELNLIEILENTPVDEDKKYLNQLNGKGKTSYV